METEINKMRTENKIKERENEIIREEMNKLKSECTSLQETLITTEGMSVCQFICFFLSLCPSPCLSLCPSPCLSLCPSLCLCSFL